MPFGRDNRAVLIVGVCLGWKFLDFWLCSFLDVLDFVGFCVSVANEGDITNDNVGSMC
jgi:hypothetical protein